MAERLQTTPAEKAGAPPSHAPHRPRLVLLVVLLCQTMFILDTSVVNIALPAVQRDLGFSPAGLSWVLNAYLLAFGGLLLLGGRAGDMLGQRRALIIGVVVFTAASLAGGLATSPGLLLAARAGQGVGAALAAPTVLALITTSFPAPAERARALGAYAAVSGSGAALGLIAGGVLTDWLSWRWVLFINVPIGAVLLALAMAFVTETERRAGRLDYAGSLTSTAGMSVLVFGLIRAAEEGFRDGVALAALGAGAVLLALFLVVEARSAHPIIPLRLFADRSRAIGYLGLLFQMAAGNGMFFFLTLFLQEARDYRPLAAGLAFLPLTALILASSNLAARLVPRTGPKPLIAAGAAVMTACLFWLTRLTPDSGYAVALLGPLVLIGAAMGVLLVGITTVLMTGVRAEDAGAASGLLNVMQQLGGALGLAILITAFGAAGRGAHGSSDEVLTEGVTTSFAVAAILTGGALLLSLLLPKRAAE
ncbi:MFS transporter [Actinomadura hibisca]|uniref:MFS transporter n=1 Tax=Actinomadura hibisca TaxID=68565 RepID=UPI000835128B|nr:MFS transporter [Actinomadura hibisca]